MFLRQYNAENIFNIQRNMIQKIYQINICILFLITNLFLLNCQKEKEISFYYWKTNFTLSKKESEALKHFKTKEIYLRFFDVDKKEKDNLIPLGVIGKISCPADTSIIPVVYITNHTFHHFRKEDAESLAQKVFSKIDSIAKENSISYNEIQIDCDWSDSTRELFFVK
jgi:spore germination protein YaaH